MHDIEDLCAILGMTPPQVRRRLSDLEDLLRGHIHQGKRNKILIDSAGLAILRRVTEYEKRGLSLNECKTIVKQELTSEKSGQGNGASSTVKVDETSVKLLDLLQEQLRVKDEQIRRLQEQIDKLYELIETRLPLPPTPTPDPDPDAETSASPAPPPRARVSRWTRLKQFLKGE